MTFRKKLVAFAPPIRNCATMATAGYMARYEAAPFDGMVFNAMFLHYQIGPTQTAALSSWMHSSYRVDWHSLDAELTSYKSIAFKKFSENYLLIGTTVPTTFGIVSDWYSPIALATIPWNYRMAARFVKQSGCRGIMFDPEPEHVDTKRIFQYSDRPYTGTYSLQAYRAKVRLIASLAMEAMQEECPGIRIAVTLGYEDCPADDSSTTNEYSLLRAFLDGLYAARVGDTKLLAYYEDGYSSYTDNQMCSATQIQNGLIIVSGSGENYKSGHKKGMATKYDGSTINNGTLATALPKSIQQVSEDTSWVYEDNYAIFQSDGSVPTMTAGTFATIDTARCTVGFQNSLAPASLPGLIMNCDPTTMGLADNTAIGSYTDSTGLVYTQTVAGQKPLFKTSGIGTSIPGVDYTAASSQCLKIDGLVSLLTGTSSIPFTLIFVFKPKSLANTFAVMGIGRSVTTDPQFSFTQKPSNYISFSVTDNTSSVNSIITGSVGAQITTGAHVASYISTGTSLNMRMDGLPVMSPDPTSIGGGTTFTFDQARIGCTAKNAQAAYADMVVGRIIMYKGALGIDAVRWLEQSLANEALIQIQAA